MNIDKPSLIKRVSSNVPQRLRELPIWLLHDSRKVPIYADGRNRTGNLDSQEDRNRLVTFKEAATALPRVDRASGLGIALGEVPGEEICISGIDLDGCCQGDEFDDRAMQILAGANSYAERSPSGKGLHVLGIGDIGTLKVAKTAERPGLELYSKGRYFTVTGNHVNGADLSDIADAAAMARKLFGVDDPAPEGEAKPGDPVLADIKAKGLYLKPAKGGKHLIRCPWEPNHTPDRKGNRHTSTSETAYFEPGSVGANGVMKHGAFVCQHAHCSDRGLKHLREYLGLERKGEVADWTPPAVITYGESFDPASIPQRQWILGRRRSRGELTIDVGPPGVNKSMLMLTDAVQIVTGHKILADTVHEQGPVLLLAGEDARRDIEARLAAILQQYHIPPAELDGKLHIVYLMEIDPTVYTLGQMEKDMAVLNTRMLEWLRSYPDVIAVFIDPLAAWHHLIENSNEALQILCTALRSIAAQGARHVGIDHHVTKVCMSDPEAHVGNLAAIRGAGAIGAYTRWAFSMARLKLETATELGIPVPDHRRYRRLDPLKASYGPDDEQTRLLRVDTVRIDNGESVGVLVEVDMERTRADAQERQAEMRREADRLLAEALTRMLGEFRPRSLNDTAFWLSRDAPELVRNDQTGKPLTEQTIRKKLPAMIGNGLATTNHGKPARIIVRLSRRKGQPAEIDFEQGELLPG